MTKYKTKPYTIDAFQYDGDNFPEVSEFTGGKVKHEDGFLYVWDYLQTTWVLVNKSDYVIRGGLGEYYSCREEVFGAKYEAI